MTGPTLHPLPSPRTVALEQLRLVRGQIRREIKIFAAFLLGATAVTAMHYVDAMGNPARGDGAFPFEPVTLAPIAALAALAPLGLWWKEPPSGRDYHWAMPVDQARHSLLRMLSGWVWVQAALLVVVLWGVAMALATGGDLGIASRLELLPGGEGGRRVAYAVAAWQWIVPFTTATIVYLLGSAIALGSDRPLAWVAGIVVGWTLLNVTLSATRAEELSWLVGWVAVRGRYAIDPALTGTVETVHRVLTERGHRWGYMSSVPDVRAWLAAMSLWMGLGVAAVLYALHRRTER